MIKDTATPREPLLKWIWRSYFRTALIPLLLVEVVLIAIYLLANNLARDNNIEAMRHVADDELLRLAQRETVVLQKQLEAVAQSTRLFANTAQRALSTPVKPGEIPAQEYNRYAYDENGVYYSPRDDGGAAVYYSDLTQNKDIDKVLRTSRLDPFR